MASGPQGGTCAFRAREARQETLTTSQGLSSHIRRTLRWLDRLVCHIAGARDITSVQIDRLVTVYGIRPLQQFCLKLIA